MNADSVFATIMQIIRLGLPLGFFVVGLAAFVAMGWWMRRGERIELVSHWGGLGGGLGGWRLSRPLGYLAVGALCFLLAVGLMPAEAKPKPKPEPAAGAAADNTGGKPDGGSGSTP